MPTRRAAALLILLLPCTISCGDAGVPNTEILGKWKRVTDTTYGQDQAEFKEGGSCAFVEGTKKLNCRWSGLPDGTVEVKLGSFIPIVSTKGSIVGDEMLLEHGDDSASSWVRAGSQLDKNNTDYFEGLALIQSGNLAAGMAQWQRAASQGHHGSQNSLAWIYAADKNPALHDGKKAVAYAEKATTSLRHYTYLDTFAAALARDGQFERAAQIEQEAIALLEESMDRSADRDAALQRFRNRLALYRAGQPYADS